MDEGFSATCFSGCLDFTSNSTTAAQNPFNTNHSYANALLGCYTTYSESNTRPFRGANQWNLEWFAQDSWKVRDTLTLELGVRFAAGTPWHLRHDGWKGYNPPPGERAAAWLADAYDPRRNPVLYEPVCAPPATTCGAAGRLARNPLTGAILPNSVALIGQLVPASGEFYNGLILDNDARVNAGTFQPNPATRAQPRLGCRHVPVFGAGQAPAGAALRIAVGPRQRTVSVLAVASHRMDADRRPGCRAVSALRTAGSIPPVSHVLRSAATATHR